MTTVIAEANNSNHDCDTMSPALTRDHNQDVVNATAECSQLGISAKKTALIDSLQSSFQYSESNVKENGSTPSKCKETRISLANDVEIFVKKKDTESNVSNSPNDNANNNSSPVHGSGLDSANTMTPRVVFPCLKSAVASLTIESSGTSLFGHLPVITSGNISGDSTSAKVSLSDVNAQHDSMERKISNVVKRIARLQSILATRQGQKQLKDFVLDQHALPVDNTSHNVLESSLAASSTASERAFNRIDDAPSVGLTILPHRSPDRDIDVAIGNSKVSSIPSTSGSTDKSWLQDDVCVMLHNLKQMQTDVDSDVTDSSSGEDTSDDDSTSRLYSIHSSGPKCDAAKDL